MLFGKKPKLPELQARVKSQEPVGTTFQVQMNDRVYTMVVVEGGMAQIIAERISTAGETCPFCQGRGFVRD